MPYEYVIKSKTGIPIGSTSIKEVADLMREWADENYPEGLPIPDAIPHKVTVKIVPGPPRSIGDQGIIQYIHNFLPHYIGNRQVLAQKLQLTNLRSKVLTGKPPELTGRRYLGFRDKYAYIEVELDRGKLKTHDQIKKYVLTEVVSQLAKVHTRAQIADWMCVTPSRVTDLLWQLNYKKPDDEKIEPIKADRRRSNDSQEGLLSKIPVNFDRQTGLHDL